jgi:hypothetical protein
MCIITLVGSRRASASLPPESTQRRPFESPQSALPTAESILCPPSQSGLTERVRMPGAPRARLEQLHEANPMLGTADAVSPSPIPSHFPAALRDGS